MPLPSGRSEKIHNSEKLARFFTKRKNKPYSNVNGVFIAKPSSLIPDNNTETSVSRIDKLDELNIKNIGDKVCEKIQENEASRNSRSIIKSRCYSLGRIEIIAQECRNASLEVEADEEPLHHANIINWAGCNGKSKLDNYSTQKLKRKKQALQALKDHQVVMHRNPIDDCFMS